MCGGSKQLVATGGESNLSRRENCGGSVTRRLRRSIAHSELRRYELLPSGPQMWYKVMQHQICITSYLAVHVLFLPFVAWSSAPFTSCHFINMS